MTRCVIAGTSEGEIPLGSAQARVRERFTPERMATQYLELYRQFLPAHYVGRDTSS